MDDIQISILLGRAALKVWPQLPPEAQEMLFKAATDDGVIANALGTYLHDYHPRTAHPPKPTVVA
ncbi:hypothetical protein [Tardiphaga sp.]|jgi:hypothetical protein|uniref:hypothetical protein n=1 Tax=Tardiphaga sp. TaxID=1926292 RepID=UPI0037D9E6B6